jgi:hypothetical protein
MRKGGGRQKGSAFEREIAKQIIEAFAHKGITKEDCYRTPGSGGHRFAKKVDPGDLVFSKRLRKYWEFAVECKFYASISMDLLMVPNVKEGVISAWWKQAVASAGNHKPLLVFRQNRQQAYALFPATADWNGDIRPMIQTKVNGQEVYVVRFKSFLRMQKKVMGK